MLNLLWPWLLTLLPLPLVYRRWRTARQPQLCALRAPALMAVAGADLHRGKPAKQQLMLLLLWLVWLCLVLAAARPVWVGEPVALPTSGRDLLLAVDISGSMEQEDMEVDGQYVNRLVAVKAVVGEFVSQRQGDRLGLVLFGEQAYLQTPLTFDRETMRTLLNEAQVGFAGNKTAIGDAIGLSVKRLQDRPQEHRVVILLTDGANTAGELEPLRAAELAASAGVKIYTIGVGAEVMERSRMLGLFSTTYNPSADLDEETLTAIATQTGGKYYRARNPQELFSIYAELNRLEPIEQETETIRPVAALFHWPLALAFALSLLLSLLRRGGLYA